MHLFVALWLDLAFGGTGDRCTLEHQLLRPLERYCATASRSEQSSCRIMRSRFSACTVNAYESTDGGVHLEIYDDRIVDGVCLHLDFTRKKNGELRLDSFSKANTTCACDCCP
jgi:hypothetical protein